MRASGMQSLFSKELALQELQEGFYAMKLPCNSHGGDGGSVFSGSNIAPNDRNFSCQWNQNH
jgi:hypothetical protein